MTAYARWTKKDKNFFRDETILQFGHSFDLIANIILLNPGSAIPKSNKIFDDFLTSKNLPYLKKPTPYQHYYEFALDPLMRNLLNCFSKIYSGGVVKIYNLFNLKNSNSNEAIKMLDNLELEYLFTNKVNFLNKPVIFAVGDKVNTSKRLKDEILNYYNQAKDNPKYYLSRSDKKEFRFKKIQNKSDIFNSYHPSYTFAYGNKTICEKLDIKWK